MNQSMKTAFLAFAVLTSVSMAAQNFQFNFNPKLNMAFSAIENYYVDEVDDKKMVEDAIVGILDKLDPHSEYSNPTETKQMNEPLQGNFSGIGVQFNMMKDTLFVIQVIPGGPSEKVGILAGDRILQANDTLIAGVKMKTTDIMKRLRGPKGTVVNLIIQRKGGKEPIVFKVTRDKIPIHSLDAAYMVEPGIGYIKLNRFAASSHEEYLKAFHQLKKEGMTSLILDLQGNGGGYLNAAIDLTDEFLSSDKMIVYTEGRKSPRDEAFSTAKGGFEKGKLAVLIDESSASASEIVSGAIQDWDRGVIVGRRSFGKGLVQRPIPLPDGSMIRLTIARYFTPAGRSIQKPYTNGNSEDYAKEVLDRYNKGEFLHEDSIHFPDSLKRSTLLNKRIVYAGGGIMPDIFVPLDTTKYTAYHRKVVASGVIHRYCYQILDKDRKAILSRYKEVTAFDKGYTFSPDLWNGLKALAEEEKIVFDQAQFDTSRPLMELQIKALLARDLYGTTQYYQVINRENESLLRALSILKDEAEYDRLMKEGRKR